MIRRKFIKNSALASVGVGMSSLVRMMKYKDVIIGHGDYKYKVDLNWGALNSSYYPVNDCHEMVQDSKGRILLLTNNTKNNIIIYDKSGRLIDTWGTEFPGAHGLTLKNEGGEDFLYICDTSRHELIKTTIDGKIVMVIPFPEESGKYPSSNKYVPTESAIADNGDIYVADGYGMQYIMHYNAKGQLLNVFGGKGEEEKHFDNAHGVCIDDRGSGPATLLITARAQNKLKRFTMAGEHIETYDLPGSYICRPVIKGDNVYIATIWSGAKVEGSGYVSILDKNNQLVSAPGGIQPVYKDGKLEPMTQSVKVFHHPHDVCVDDDDNLYVAQWNSAKTYPIKLERV